MILETEFDVKERILKTATSLFKQYGFSKVTVEDIISNLKISKKTVYKHFKCKKDILASMIKREQMDLNRATQKILDDPSKNLRQKLKAMVALHQNKQFTDIQFLLDLKNKFPDVYNELEEFRRQQIPKNIEKIIAIGIQENEIKSNINKQFIGLICVGACDAIFKPEVLINLPFSLSEAVDELINAVFFGILKRNE